MPIGVLLADDPDVGISMQQRLEAVAKHRMVVGHASNGREALRQAAVSAPDVAIVDIVMPELDGIELTRQLRRACPQTRVVILSMYSTSEHIYRALQAGARGYLLKASAGAEVVSAVRDVHAGRRYLSRTIAETVVDDYLRDRHANSPLGSLSRRERQVLQGVAEGRTTTEMARALCLSPKTVDTYRSRLLHKLEVDGVAGLVRFAIECGLTTP